ncbi:hypothetical protein [Roseibium sp. RKSG952]|uniref:hypothetical protein n=1 Tax=Roseibium sp. RKSG952 TaxID=2529384 RepID=UPI0012BC63AF|nr:hypothetical protein [Roseibium sp. RKSG952]MTH95482.1 hypothetical protein [Roseibium sp. RKSG952]
MISIRKLFAAFLFLFTLVPAAHAACELTPEHILRTSPYFSERMTASQDSTQYSVSYQHVDDPRIVATFSVSPAQPVGEVSRSDYVSLLEEQSRNFVNGVVSRGRWADYSVYPFDPVATRIIEQDEVDRVGTALVGQMRVRMTPECLLTAYYLAPASMNLRSRWVELDTRISELRDRASFLTVPETWLPDDTTPVGGTALGIGFGVPVAVMALLFFLMGNMRDLDGPRVLTKTVMVCSGIVGIGVIAVQFQLYQEGLAELRYVDNFALLATLAILSFAGAFGGTPKSLFVFIASCVTGITLSINSYLDWTPVPAITSFAGVALILMGVFGFYVLSSGSIAGVGSISELKKKLDHRS